MNAIEKPHLVVVDDEPQVLTAIEDQFEADFVVHAAGSAGTALEMLESLDDVSVLLTDQRMPGMTGHELLAKAAELSDATRVLITGYADLDAVIRAVNLGKLFGYVTKPWDSAELHLMLNKADQHHRLMRELQHERDLLRNLMDNVPDEIYFKGRDHRYIRVNWPAARGHGMAAPEAAIGCLDADYIADEKRAERIHAEDLRVFESGKPIEVDERRVMPDGTEYWLSKTKAPVRDQAGNVTSLVAISRDITARKNLEQDLVARETLLRKVLETLPVGVWVTDRAGQLIMQNPAGEAIWRGRRDGGAKVDGEYKGWCADRAIPIGVEESAIARAVKRGETSINEVQNIECFDGARKTILNSAAPIIDARGQIQGAVVVNEDVTERRRQEKRIARLTRMHAMLSGINATIVRVRSRDELFDETCRLAVETGGFKIINIRMLDESGTSLVPVAFVGPDEFAPLPLPLKGERGDASAKTTAVRAFVTKGIHVCNDLEADISQTPQGTRSLAMGIASVASLPLITGEQAIGVLTFSSVDVNVFDGEEIRLLEDLAGDISFALDHIAKSEKVDYLSYYDPLTGLANRALFHQRLEQQLIAASHDGRKIAVFVLDIERFKPINEAFGRQEGDQLLKQVAHRLVEHGGDASGLSRTEADHFAIVAVDIGHDEGVGRYIEQGLSAVFGSAFRVGGQELRVAARAGIAIFPNDAADAETLLRNAEAALKMAKERGERYVFFEQRMTERVAEMLTLENKLRQALEKEEFVLHYQPKVDLENRSIVGVEALLRWQSPDLGLVPPLQFISLLEETGLILAVGKWALERAALDHRGWVDQGLKAPRVAVNVSSIQLRSRDFVSVVEQAIGKGVSPTGIDLEITESLIMADIQGNIEKLNAVRGLGVTVAIDDFGTGYSSLSYLAKLPVHTLKIDRSFIIALNDDPNATTLVSTMISLAHSLHLKVVAEGVETEEQAKFLRLLKCDEMQGYLLSKPLPLAEMTALLRKTNG
jgi:diguanylate cyclase (GGDEF)-like protein/PAS domain S-box-containing protein